MRKLLFGFCLLFCASALAESGVVVFGSFSDLDNARRAERQVAERFGITDSAIVEAFVRGQRFYRVVGPEMDRADGRALVSRLVAGGLTGAWFLPGKALSPAPPAEAASTSAVPAVRPAAMTPTSTMPAAGAPESSGAPEIGTDLQLRPGPSGEGGIAIRIPRFEDVDIKIDGRLDEPIWDQVPGYDEMRVIDPDTLAKPRFKTVTKFLYTPEGMYIGARMEQPPETLIARLSGRDTFINRDSWGITLDTSGQGLYGYWFVVNLGGAVLDGKVAPERRYSNEWDGPWESATAVLADGWSMEMFLPWAMMSMPAPSEDREMGFWINRKVAYINERWSWPALPFTGARFMSALAKMELPGVTPKRQLAFAPFVASTYDVDQQEDDHRIGMDIFWRPSSNIQVAATLNPDFGSVESDDVVVNLTAFETFFPEKRLFFQEGNEVFITTPRGRVRRSGPGGSGGRSAPSFFNPSPTTLVNTRRIGGEPRNPRIPDGVSVPSHELGKFTELLGAARVTGQQGSLRYGFLGAFEEDYRLRGVKDGMPVRVKGPGRDFGIARLAYEDTRAGRRSIGYLGTYVAQPTYDAFVHGVDTHWLSRDGRLNFDGQAVVSDVDDVLGYGGFGDITYTPKTGVKHLVAFEWLDDKLEINDLGFLRRNDNRRLRYSLELDTSRGLKRLRNRRINVILNQEANSEWRMTRGGYFLRSNFTFPNNFRVGSEFAYFPPNWDDRNSRGNGSFRSHSRISSTVNFGTDLAKKLSVSALVSAQQEQIEGRFQHVGAAGFTWKPTGRFSLDFDMQYRRRNGWLLYNSGNEFTTYRTIEWRPKLALGVFFNAHQQLRLTMQWAGISAKGQSRFLVPVGDGGLTAVPLGPGVPARDFTISQMTTQLRYRWEIAPLSDLFVVYTRGSNIPSDPDAGLYGLFEDAVRDTVIDMFVIKLRYRFGT